MKLFIVALFLLSAPSWASAGLTLVQDGKPTAIIVVPDAAKPVELLAAKELRHHLQKASGGELPVLREEESASRKEPKIYIGAVAARNRAGLSTGSLAKWGYEGVLQDEGFFFFGVDGDGELPAVSPVRFPVGTLMAVYDFLEEQLGVRWVWPGETGEIIPQRPTITIDSYRKAGAPKWEHVELRSKLNREPEGWASPASREKFFREQDQWLLRQRFVTVRYHATSHSFTHYWERYHQTHRDYFSRLPNGERRPLEGDTNGEFISMCVSNPQLHRQIVEDWLAQPGAKDVDPPIINACDNDSPGLCTCPNCRAWDAASPLFQQSPYWAQGVIPSKKERFPLLRTLDGSGETRVGSPSLSDRYAKFYLALQREAARHRPDVMVFGSAYANHAAPPRETKLNDRIIVSYTGWPYFPWTKEKQEKMRRDWDGWRNTGARIFLRPNSTQAGHNMPIFYARPLAAEFQHCVQAGMFGSYFDSFLGQWGTQGPTLYILGRMHVRPDLSADQMLDEYYSAFGAAKKEVKDYFAFWERVSDAVSDEDFNRYCSEEGGGRWKTWLLVADRIFTPQIMKQGRELLDKAVKVAAEAGSVPMQRVAILDAGLRHAELTLAALAAAKELKRNNTPQAHMNLRARVRELEIFRAEHEQMPLANLSYLAYRERQYWDRSFLRSSAK